jgi:hypothetical protein
VACRDEEEEGSQMKSNLESYSVYHFNKILSSDSYTIGKKVSVFITDFLKSNSDVPLGAAKLPQQVSLPRTLK